MGKRKEDQWRDDSSSSSSSSSFDAKRRRPRQYQNGPKDGTLTLIQMKDTIQDKESTEAKLHRKIVKLKEKRKKDKEDLRILKGHVGILMENFTILKEGHEYLKSKIQEMRKEGCAEVDHYKASPSQRSQLSRSTRYRLVIENSVSGTIYKNETVETEDGGGRIKVIMHDGGNPIAPDHPLASVKVDLVVIEGRFNDKRDSWSKEEFEKSIITPREGMIRLVKNGSFHLIGGSCDHQGAIIMDNSQKKEVKLGVMIAVHREERVLEGVSNPFKVQEGKTKRSQKKGKQPSSPVPTPILGQSTNAYSTQHGQGPVSSVCQDSLPKPLQKSGQALNGNGQDFSQLSPAQLWGQLTSANPMQHGQGPVSPVCQDSLPPPFQKSGQALNGNGQYFSQQLAQAWQWSRLFGSPTDQGPVSPVCQDSLPSPFQKSGQALNGNDQDFYQRNVEQVRWQSTRANPTQRGQARNDNGQNILREFLSLTGGQSTNANPMQHVYGSPTGQGLLSPVCPDDRATRSSTPPIIHLE